MTARNSSRMTVARAFVWRSSEAAGVDEFLRAYLTPAGRAALYAAARQIYLEAPHGKPVSGPGYASSTHASYSSGVAATRSCQSRSHATSPRLPRKPVTSSWTADTCLRWSDPGRRTRQLLRFSRSRQSSAPLAIRRPPSSSTPRTVDPHAGGGRGHPGLSQRNSTTFVNGHRCSLSTAIGVPHRRPCFRPTQIAGVPESPKVGDPGLDHESDPGTTPGRRSRKPRRRAARA
jgi:hypothetical protein